MQKNFQLLLALCEFSDIKSCFLLSETVFLHLNLQLERKDHVKVHFSGPQSFSHPNPFRNCPCESPFQKAFSVMQTTGWCSLKEHNELLSSFPSGLFKNVIRGTFLTAERFSLLF